MKSTFWMTAQEAEDEIKRRERVSEELNLILAPKTCPANNCDSLLDGNGLIYWCENGHIYDAAVMHSESFVNPNAICGICHKPLAGHRCPTTQIVPVAAPSNAEFHGTCYLCAQPIMKGDSIQRWTVCDTPVAAHAVCVEENTKTGVAG